MIELDIMKLYVETMMKIYHAMEQESLAKTGAEYEESLDQMATLRAHLYYTRVLIEEFENQL